MSIRFVDGQVLFVDGAIAMHEDCCCTEGTCYGWLIFKCDEDAWVLDAQGYFCEEDEEALPDEGWSEETEEGVDYATYVRHGPDCTGEGTCEDWFEEEEWPGVEDVPYDCDIPEPISCPSVCIGVCPENITIVASGIGGGGWCDDLNGEHIVVLTDWVGEDCRWEKNENLPEYTFRATIKCGWFVGATFTDKIWEVRLAATTFFGGSSVYFRAPNTTGCPPATGWELYEPWSDCPTGSIHLEW